MCSSVTLYIGRWTCESNPISLHFKGGTKKKIRNDLSLFRWEYGMAHCAAAIRIRRDDERLYNTRVGWNRNCDSGCRESFRCKIRARDWNELLCGESELRKQIIQPWPEERKRYKFREYVNSRDCIDCTSVLSLNKSNWSPQRCWYGVCRVCGVWRKFFYRAHPISSVHTLPCAEWYIQLVQIDSRTDTFFDDI